MPADPEKAIDKLVDQWAAPNRLAASARLPAAREPPPPPAKKTALDPPLRAREIPVTQETVGDKPRTRGRLRRIAPKILKAWKNPTCRRAAGWVLLGVVIGVLADRVLPAVFATIGTYEYTWALVDDDGTGKRKEVQIKNHLEEKRYWKEGTTFFTDTCRRSDQAVIYRKTETPLNDQWPNSVTMEGPMSEGGKPHGHWKVGIFDLETREFKNLHRWYWYGEEISEGTWHLRNSGQDLPGARR